MREQAYPPLRKDLRLSRQDTPEGPRFVVKDPQTRRFFRFREAEYAVIRRLDGTTPLDAIAKDVSAELDGELTTAALEPFVRQLRRLGLLEGAAVARPKPRLFQGTMLWLRLKAFDPDRLLNRMIGRLGFCFTPYFLLVSVAAIVLALVLTATEHAAILRDMSRLWRLENLVLAWITILAVTTGHEFAHGLACKRFGGEVHEMGFLLIYFQPAFYCNISDAWLFPKKSHRLCVTFAGAYFELFVWALATLLWRVVEPGTWISLAALVVMATSGIKLFFNLNPLIKLDGYYLLCDLLDLANLRARAFRYVRQSVTRLLGFEPAEAAAPTPRECRIFLGYGILAVAFSYWFLATILLRFGHYLTWRYEGWGAVAFLGLLTGVFWSPIRRMLPRRSRAPVPDGAGAQPSQWASRVKLLVLGVGVLVLLYVVPLDLKVSGEFTVLPRHNADVRAKVEGIIERVYVAEGDRVAPGDTIARLADDEYRARLRAVEAEIAEKTMRLRLLRAGPRAKEIELAEVAAEKAKELLRYAENEFGRTKSLMALDAASQAALEEAEEGVTVRRKELEEARARLDVLRAGARPEEIAAVEQEVARLEAERARLDTQLDGVTIVSPDGGIVTTPKLEEKVGEFVAPGDRIAEVHALETVHAEIQVPERDIGEVRLGRIARLRLRAYPEQTFEGRVTTIAPAVTAEAQGFERTVRVDIEIDNASGLLKPGLTGYARISCGKRRALDLLTRRFRRFLRVEFWSWW